MNIRQERLSRIPVLAVLALALALLASVLLAARVLPVVTWLDVGSPGDKAYTRFDFPPESNGKETFRWTSDHAELRIPVERAGRYRLDLHIATVSPADRVLRLTCDQQVVDIPLASVDAYSTVPIECSTGSNQIELALDVPVVRLPNGGRALGVSVRDVRATALDTDDRLAFRAFASLTIFGSLAGTGLVLAALRRSTPWLWLAGSSALLVVWIGLVERGPDQVLSAVSGPEGVLILSAGVTAQLLARERTGKTLIVGMLAAVAVIAIPQADASLLLEAPWTRVEINALNALPGLAAIAVLAASLLRGRRGPWLAVAGAAVGLISIAMPALSSWTVRRWTHVIKGPAWIDTGSVAGAVYVVAAFIIAGLAILVVLTARERTLLRVTLAATTIVASLLLWRIEVMRLNGDEQHYYVTSRSIAVDGDLELLNNYLESQYVESTYSPIGNVSSTRDASVLRYAGSVPAPADSWYFVPPLDEGWHVDGGSTGMIPAAEPAPAIRGPNGALAIPPPLTPATRHAILLEGPCAVDALAIGVPLGEETGEFLIRIFNSAGNLLYADRRDALPPEGMFTIPPAAGLCQGQGTWTVTIEAEQAQLIVEGVDRYNGLQLTGGPLQTSWLFAGLPRDRYGSVDVLTHLLLYNPSDEVILVTARLLTPSNLTTSEISFGLQPGQTYIEPLPVFGADAVAVTATTPVEFGATLYAVVEDARYRIPSTQATETFETQLGSNPDRDAGLWLTIINPHGEPMRAEIQDGDGVSTPSGSETLDVCGYCAATRLIEAGSDARTLRVSGLNGAWFAATAITYEERTGMLHFDLGLPLLAVPLAGFDDYWPILIVTALAGITLAPGLFLLLRASGIDERRAGTLALIALTLAPISTYAVRFYTDILTAALLVWALVLWERADRSNRALAGMAAVAVALPFVHGRLTPLALVVLALALLSAAHSGILWVRAILQRYPPRTTIFVGIGGIVIIGLAGLIVVQRYAVALGSRGIENFFNLDWVARNSVGMLLDRGSGVLPFAPWLIFALVVPRPLRRTQRGALLITLIYYAILTLRAGGWQTFGSPLRYLLPIIPLMATLALPGMLRLWFSGRTLLRAAVVAALSWSLLVTMLLHWRPLSGYIDRGGPRNNYLIDQALSWLPFPSPFKYMPTIEALPGPTWADPIGAVILATLAAWALWLLWPLVRESLASRGSAERAGHR